MHSASMTLRYLELCTVHQHRGIGRPAGVRVLSHPELLSETCERPSQARRAFDVA
jgi:hypothetical protein